MMMDICFVAGSGGVVLKMATPPLWLIRNCKFRYSGALLCCIAAWRTRALRIAHDDDDDA
jgi:hypothetical protein